MTAIDEVTTAEATESFTGSLHELGSAGDTRVTWDRRNLDEVAAARTTFDRLRSAGYAAFLTRGKNGQKQGEQIRAFDPEAEQIVLTRPLQGG